MVTSRTGSTKYRSNRDRVLGEAKANGLVFCPGYEDSAGVHHPCGVELDYDTPLLANSAEVDHIIPFAAGGSDDFDNLRVLCRRQNTERNRIIAPPIAPALNLFPILGEYLTDAQVAASRRR